jgi:ferredoxin
MLSSGKSPLKTGCSGGGCGVCRTRVASGEYAVEKKMSKAHVDEKDQGEGWVLLCCIKPRSDLLLESVGEKKNAITAFAGL